ncbi:hypothetical protein [Chondrinema litorale]|uniref:hypothetical protein n=1 Tax=Chondrinema litorale TaxID=2994555 RepID=UPI002543EC7B|nr:hypothetical protein [Chondrinema litorale]UZR94691.1 hypothetical protein OQ292_02520 [Chondrinema litorale]
MFKHLFIGLLLSCCFNVCFAQLPTASVLIDKGNKYAQSYTLDIQLECENAVKMMVSNYKNFTGAHWTAFEPRVHWELFHEDGEQFVYAKFLDKDNNEIGPVSDNILVDATAPANASVSIDMPNKVSNKKSHIVDLKINAEGAKYMMVSNNGAFYGLKWQFYEDELLDWELEKGGDGEYTVYAKFRDVAGNVSETVKDKIIFDTQKPFNCSVEINNGEKFTYRQDGKVDLSIFANEVDSMIISNDKEFKDAAWQPYATSTEWFFENGDATKSVYIKFKDMANNESGIFTDNIILDTTPPQDCEFYIDAGAGITTDINKKVHLRFGAEGASHMLISNFPDFRSARWQVYRNEIHGWKLEGEEDGSKVVYVKFKDDAGNVSTIFRDDIELKRGF